MAERCPFIDPTFEMDINEPCPVCGQLGLALPEHEDLCVGDDVTAPPREVESE